MSELIKGMKMQTNLAYTENGARAYGTTGSDVLDFFCRGGAMRTAGENEIIRLFDKALCEDKLLALKTLYYLRNIRGLGQGERRLFRLCLNNISYRYPEMLIKNINNIIHFGRYDDVLELAYNSDYDVISSKVIEFIKTQLEKDMKSEHPTLLAKWMPSENTSSKETRAKARKWMQWLDMTPDKYRKMLSVLRKRINIVESNMSANRWEAIDYEAVPSKAGLNYRKAFFRHDGERYVEFIEAVAQSKAKVNTKTLYPHEIIKKVLSVEGNESYDTKVLDTLWNNLPDFTEGFEENSLCVVDVSGSMYNNRLLPITVAISLGIYFGERINGAFKNHFITFSSKPKLVEIVGSTIADKVNNMTSADWAMNTDIEAVFNLILSTAIKNNLPQEELPTRLYIISDMEFDDALCYTYDNVLTQKLHLKYEKAGYKLPKLLFWNVDSRHQQFPATLEDEGITMVSGFSPSILQGVLKGETLNMYDFMLQILNDESFERITV